MDRQPKHLPSASTAALTQCRSKLLDALHWRALLLTDGSAAGIPAHSRAGLVFCCKHGLASASGVFMGHIGVRSDRARARAVQVVAHGKMANSTQMRHRWASRGGGESGVSFGDEWRWGRQQAADQLQLGSGQRRALGRKGDSTVMATEPVRAANQQVGRLELRVGIMTSA